MDGLDAIVQERMLTAKDHQKYKQATRFRLTSDPTITVTSLVTVLVSFLQYKGTKDLLSLVEPPPSGPLSFGWHTAPAPDWLVKVSNLLYGLLGVAKNSKLNSAKLSKALETMFKNRDLDLKVSRHSSSQDCIDRIDFSIRVLMNQLRMLKSQPVLKAKTFRSLCKEEQLRLEALLERLVLPPELMNGAEEEEDDEPKMTLRGHPPPEPVPKEAAPPDLALVEVPQDKVVALPRPNTKGAKGSNVLKPLPNVFLNILGKQPSNENIGTPSTAGGGSGFAMSQVLSQALMHKPLVVDQLTKPKVSKPKKKASAAPKTKAKAVKKPASKKTVTKGKKTKVEEPAPVAKKSKGEDSAGEQDGSKYQAGEMIQHRILWIEKFMESNDCTRAFALSQWPSSLRRAQLLAKLSLPELKRRRFVDKDAKTNPFKEKVEAEQDLD